MKIRRLVPIRATFPQEVAILDLLLSQGIDINAQDKAGQTVLHLAVPDAIDAASIELLLKRGAEKSHAGNASYATAFATMSGCWPITRT
ncbi:MAG: hypothetical protein E5Y86_29215 [Mesorhizobium sp.]|nr:MAG: hypothetical protein E5Y86_29215 [Mesorhizobium sp.]